MEKLVELLLEHKIVKFRGEARHLIAAGAVRIENNILKVGKRWEIKLNENGGHPAG